MCLSKIKPTGFLFDEHLCTLFIDESCPRLAYIAFQLATAVGYSWKGLPMMDNDPWAVVSSAEVEKDEECVHQVVWL